MYGNLVITYPEPYSIYLRGTTGVRILELRFRVQVFLTDYLALSGLGLELRALGVGVRAWFQTSRWE